MPTQYNSLIYKTSQQAFVDAAAVITLRAAGAFIFGKTATTEFAATTEGGSCMNPHDSKRTPGGSSSGSGAAVGDFQIPIALGTQTAGSMVRPGSYNGIYALKVCQQVQSDLCLMRLTCSTAHVGSHFARRSSTVVNDLRYCWRLCQVRGRHRTSWECLPFGR